MNASDHQIDALATAGGWDQFWFQAVDVRRVARLRGALCFVTACYFLSNGSDIATWFGSDGLLSQNQVANFLNTSGVESDARWRVSPLFLTDSVWIYRAWLIIGIVLCAVVAVGRGGRWSCVAVWFAVIGWANRSMLVAGIAEPLLSLSWLAAAIAPAAPLWTSSGKSHWSACLAERLLGVQATIVVLVTFATMLAGRVWWNGLGSYALAAPSEERYFAAANWLTPTAIHEPLTHLLLWSIPLGVLLAWQAKSQSVGRVMLLIWCLTIAMLTSHFIYSATLSIMLLAIRPASKVATDH